MDKDINQLRREYKERTKELNCINYTTSCIDKDMSVPEMLQAICNYLPEGWQYPEHTAAKITFADELYKTNNFKETPWSLCKDFSTTGHKEGSICVYYLKDFPQLDEGPFLKEERNLINNLAVLISGAIHQKLTKNLLYEHTERLKELNAINQTAVILRKSKSVKSAIQNICDLLPKAFQYPDFTVVRIFFDDTSFVSRNFKETKWELKKDLQTSAGKSGAIQVCYLKEFPEADEGPFLKEEIHMIDNIAGLIAGESTRFEFKKLMADNTERVKELSAINQTTRIIGKGKSFDETLSEICNILPYSWQYPKHTVVRIKYAGKTFVSHHFIETQWKQQQSFKTIENKDGSLEVFYLKKFPKRDEGPFLMEERDLINNLAMVIAGYISSIKGKDILDYLPASTDKTFQGRQLYSDILQESQGKLPSIYEFFQKRALDKYIYLDLMRFKIKEILFVASLYDAFILDYEEGFFKKIMGEVYKYGIFSIPRITKVTAYDEAEKLVRKTRFDMVVIMPSGNIGQAFDLSDTINKNSAKIPVFFLVNRKDELPGVVKRNAENDAIDKVFVWNGDSRIVFSLVKMTEDLINADNDTQVGNVQVILLVEDDPTYSSKFINTLYSIVFEQVQYTIAEEINELDKISRIRLRPKILVASNYEEAISIIDKYKDNLFWLLTDVEYKKNNVYDKNAGFKLVKYINKINPGVSVLVHSSNPENKLLAEKQEICFINKDTDHLSTELKAFVNEYLGFGAFQFKDNKGQVVDEAVALEQFREKLQLVPDETIIFHSKNDHFSRWLMARGDILIAKLLKPIKHTDFDTISAFRDYFMETIDRFLEEKNRGKVINFDHSQASMDKNIISLANGSLGGKGRGLAFIDTMINNMDHTGIKDTIKIDTPKTAVIGTDEYELFIEKNHIYDQIEQKQDDAEIKSVFAAASLSGELKDKLKSLVTDFNKPLAVRSSSLFEDSPSQPFSGVFDTYIIPNNSKDATERFEQLSLAVKLVYASVFTQRATSFFRSINFKRESEKMAVIIQELVGTAYDDYYYPHISGVAQSFNYYPVSHMKPEEGIAMIAFGLGEQIVSGRKAYRFSPVYPDAEINTAKELLDNSQTTFFAVNLEKKNIDLLKQGENAFLDNPGIEMAEKHGTIKHIVSTYDHDNDRLVPGTDLYGPRVFNYANILKYDYIPLAKNIHHILTYARESLGFPVIIEFAVDLNKDQEGRVSFYLLQVKPLIGEQLNFEIDIDKYDKHKLLLYTGDMIGNGKISDISDIIFVDRKKFNKLETVKIAEEMGKINDEMVKANKKYILIGPGRWGSRDENVGIPVSWGQISNAKVIVEVSLNQFPLDASLGSHFFHNVTAMDVGYFAVQESSSVNFIHWEMLENLKPVSQTKYFRHVRFDNPLKVMMDGKKRIALIE